ncbi:hypothetical protein [Arthrobacter sp. USHLN218]|uniref:hypothetical protein n=1 Tax=Arthrobacter sp. USHLN218 TaxID=3081232 RepID=UPI00301724CF
MINVFDLTPGTRVELLDGRQVTVAENMEDGQWVQIAEIEGADTELAHSQDILRVVEA